MTLTKSSASAIKACLSWFNSRENVVAINKRNKEKLWKEESKHLTSSSISR